MATAKPTKREMREQIPHLSVHQLACLLAVASHWLNRKPESRKSGGGGLQGTEKGRGQREELGANRDGVWASKYPFLQTFAAICRGVMINILSYDYCVDGGPKMVCSSLAAIKPDPNIQSTLWLPKHPEQKP